MSIERPIGTLSRLSAGCLGVFRGNAAVALGVSRKQLGTLVAPAHALDGEAFEIACDDARRRRLTGVPALRTYLERFGRKGLPGVRATRALLDELDPISPSRSTLEVNARRLLVANGITDFTREFPLEWNGRRWRDDPTDYEYDNDKWSVPGRHGYLLVLATWNKVVRNPESCSQSGRRPALLESPVSIPSSEG